jgi:hypothetical protein
MLSQIGFINSNTQKTESEFDLMTKKIRSLLNLRERSRGKSASVMNVFKVLIKF